MPSPAARRAMAALAIRRVPDPVLKRPAKPVERLDARLVDFAHRMVRTMRAHPRCVGLAAPQVGASVRVAVMDVTGHPKAVTSHGLLILVNPEIRSTTGTVLAREGCLSIPDFTANVRRPAAALLRAFDQHGAFREVELEGFEAVVAQHEVDHLHGLLFLDRVANVKTDVFRRKTYF